MQVEESGGDPLNELQINVFASLAQLFKCHIYTVLKGRDGVSVETREGLRCRRTEGYKVAEQLPGQLSLPQKGSSPPNVHRQNYHSAA